MRDDSRGERKRDDAALRRIAEQRASRQMVADYLTMDLDLDEETMKGAWR